VQVRPVMWKAWLHDYFCAQTLEEQGTLPFFAKRTGPRPPRQAAEPAIQWGPGATSALQWTVQGCDRSMRRVPTCVRLAGESLREDEAG
jgi:hypothetical protein